MEAILGGQRQRRDLRQARRHLREIDLRPALVVELVHVEDAVRAVGHARPLGHLPAGLAAALALAGRRHHGARRDVEAVEDVTGELDALLGGIERRDAARGPEGADEAVGGEKAAGDRLHAATGARRLQLHPGQLDRRRRVGGEVRVLREVRDLHRERRLVGEDGRRVVVDLELAVGPFEDNRVALRVVNAVVHHRHLAAVRRHVRTVHRGVSQGGTHLGDGRAGRQQVGGNLMAGDGLRLLLGREGDVLGRHGEVERRGDEPGVVDAVEDDLQADAVHANGRVRGLPCPSADAGGAGEARARAGDALGEDDRDGMELEGELKRAPVDDVPLAAGDGERGAHAMTPNPWVSPTYQRAGAHVCRASLRSGQRRRARRPEGSTGPFARAGDATARLPTPPGWPGRRGG